MSLSEALGPQPVVHVHHFYPIDPATASQQQAAVYNESLSPLVAPIVPASLQQAREQQKKTQKRKHEEVEVDSELRIGSITRRTKRSKQADTKVECQDVELYSIRPTPHRRPYVDISVLNPFDRDQYKPICLGSLDLFSFLGRGQRPKQPPFSSSPISLTRSSFTPSATPAPSNDSDYSYNPGSASPPIGSRRNLSNTATTRNRKTKIKEEDPPVSALDSDDATSCHQCRRKTLGEKMRCRKLRSDGTVCPNYFCQTCIQIRYDEVWDPVHVTWHCPRCRGFCNCSLCLRKAGWGYILDGPAAASLAGGRGRLSYGGRSRINSKAKASGGLDDDDREKMVSVRTWLARRGISLGTEEWVAERRRQGVRFVVGMSPPPGRSPYKKALLNAYLAENEEDIEEDSNETEFSVDPAQKDEAGTAALMTTGSPLLEGEASAPNPQAIESVSDLQGTVDEPGKNESTLPSVTTPKPHLRQPPTSSLTKPTTSSSSEDILGYDFALARGVRLISGLPLPRSRKKRSAASPVKKQKKCKPKKESDSDDSDADDQELSELTITPSATHARRHFTSPNLQPVDVDEKYTDGPIMSPSPSPEHTATYPDDPLSTPPPPAISEPVLVPTEHFTPLKLDSMHIKNSQAQVGHSYWAFNAFPARGHDDEHEQDHGFPSSSLSQAPLYTYYPDEDQDAIDMSFSTFNTGSGSPATTMPISNMRTSASTSGTLDHYPLTPHVHDHSYPGHGLPSFPLLEETWISPSDHGPALSMSMDMSPMETQGVSRVVHEALNAADMHSSPC